MYKYLLSLIITVSFVFSAEKTRIAILDLQEKAGVNAVTAQAASEILRSELGATQRFLVVDRQNMEAVLAEQAFQSTGCTDQSCVVELGNILNVQSMLSGSVIKVGQTYEVHVQLLDVERSLITLNEKQTVPSEEQMGQAMSLLAKRLAAQAQLSGKIIKIYDNGTVLTDFGLSDGVKKGDRLQHVRMGEAIIDPESGDLLGRERMELGELRIREFNGDKLSIAKPVGFGEKDLQEGDVLIFKDDVSLYEDTLVVSQDEEVNKRQEKTINRSDYYSRRNGVGAALSLNQAIFKKMTDTYSSDTFDYTIESSGSEFTAGGYEAYAYLGKFIVGYQSKYFNIEAGIDDDGNNIDYSDDPKNWYYDEVYLGSYDRSGWGGNKFLLSVENHQLGTESSYIYFPTYNMTIYNTTHFDQGTDWTTIMPFGFTLGLSSANTLGSVFGEADEENWGRENTSAGYNLRAGMDFGVGVLFDNYLGMSLVALFSMEYLSVSYTQVYDGPLSTLVGTENDYTDDYFTWNVGLELTGHFNTRMLFYHLRK